MVPTGNKAKHFSLVNHTTKTIYHETFKCCFIFIPYFYATLFLLPIVMSLNLMILKPSILDR